MEYCVTGPNASCTRDWCRENAVRWMPQAFELLEQSTLDSAGLIVQIDALSPDFLRTILSQSISDDDHLIDMHVENCASLGLDGKFITRSSTHADIIIAGLYSNEPEPPNLSSSLESKWERWSFATNSGSSTTIYDPYIPKYSVFTPPNKALPKSLTTTTIYDDELYHMSRVTDISLRTQVGYDNNPSIALSRQDAIDVAASMMSNSMGHDMHLINSKLFYSFKTVTTEPWPFAKRKCLAAILNALTRKTEQDALCWLYKKNSGGRGEWHFPSLGPRQPAWIGGIHITATNYASATYTWHSVMHCSISISEDPKVIYDPIKINVITSW